MSKILSSIGNALSFAHLAGIGMKKKADSEDDPEKERESERDHEDETDGAKKGKRAKAEEDREREKEDIDAEEEEGDDDDKEKKGKKAKKAKAEGEEDDEEACDDKRGKKGKRAKSEGKDDENDEEDEDVEMRGSSPIAQARLREQRRCAAIFASSAAAKNPVLAANLAFCTRMTRTEALAVLEATPAASAAQVRTRHNPDVGTGASASLTTKQAVDKSLDLAFSKVAGRRK